MRMEIVCGCRVYIHPVLGGGCRFVLVTIEFVGFAVFVLVNISFVAVVIGFVVVAVFVFVNIRFTLRYDTQDSCFGILYLHLKDVDSVLRNNIADKLSTQNYLLWYH